MSETEEKGSENIKSEITVKHDWYQTQQQVIIQTLIKNVDGSKVQASFTENDVEVKIPFPNDGTIFVKKWSLAHKILPARCFFKTTPTKVEIRVSKAEENHWSELEKKEEAEKKAFTRNWDKVVSEFEEDKPEGEAALNALFQKIYAEGSDEVKKAMNKSYLESAGTELNTNWDSVKKGKVSVKPPDGMEWRTWDQ